MPEVILKQDIFKLGDRGDVVRVAAGYARNYLYPQGLAIPADKGSLKQLKAMRAAAAREALRLQGDAEQQAAALEGVVIRIVARASLNNQLYGSVTSRDVAAKLGDLGVPVDRHRIQMATPVRTLGDYEVPIHIYKDLGATIKLEVRAEGREDEPLTRHVDVETELAPAPAPAEAEAEADAVQVDAGMDEGQAVETSEPATLQETGAQQSESEASVV